jgi:hypothetical protein
MEGGDLGKSFGGLPVFWKFWVPLTLLLMLAGLVWGASRRGERVRLNPALHPTRPARGLSEFIAPRAGRAGERGWSAPRGRGLWGRWRLRPARSVGRWSRRGAPAATISTPCFCWSRRSRAGWLELPEVNHRQVTIRQTRNEFSAECSFREGRAEIRWRVFGTICKDGRIAGHLVVLKSPPGWKNQVRTGALSPDGTP